MKNKIPLIIIGILALLALSAFIVFRVQAVKNSSNQIKNSDSGLILFYGDGCQHCVNLEKYLTDNKVENKIAIDKLEVFNNKVNALLLADKAKKCGLDTKYISVPFLWNGTTAKCLTGDVDIIKFFQDKVSQ
jgi:type II secretory pathway pseudopilin PulG